MPTCAPGKNTVRELATSTKASSRACRWMPRSRTSTIRAGSLTTKMLIFCLCVLPGTVLVSGTPITVRTPQTSSLILFPGQPNPPTRTLRRRTSHLPSISLTKDIVAHRCRSPFFSSVTDPTVVAAIPPMPLVDRISQRTCSRLTRASYSLHASLSNTSVVTIFTPVEGDLCL